LPRIRTFFKPTVGANDLDGVAVAARVGMAVGEKVGARDGLNVKLNTAASLINAVAFRTPKPVTGSLIAPR
jgi:hypothetical protein